MKKFVALLFISSCICATSFAQTPPTPPGAPPPPPTPKEAFNGAKKGVTNAFHKVFGKKSKDSTQQRSDSTTLPKRPKE